MSGEGLKWLILIDSDRWIDDLNLKLFVSFDKGSLRVFMKCRYSFWVFEIFTQPHATMFWYLLQITQHEQFNWGQLEATLSNSCNEHITCAHSKPMQESNKQCRWSFQKMWHFIKAKKPFVNVYNTTASSNSHCAAKIKLPIAKTKITTHVGAHPCP